MRAHSEQRGRTRKRGAQPSPCELGRWVGDARERTRLRTDLRHLEKAVSERADAPLHPVKDVHVNRTTQPIPGQGPRWSCEGGARSRVLGPACTSGRRRAARHRQHRPPGYKGRRPTLSTGQQRGKEGGVVCKLRPVGNSPGGGAQLVTASIQDARAAGSDPHQGTNKNPPVNESTNVSGTANQRSPLSPSSRL